MSKTFNCKFCGRHYDDGITKCTSDDCPSLTRKSGEHLFADCGGVPKCTTCGCDEDTAFVGGETCSYKVTRKSRAKIVKDAKVVLRPYSLETLTRALFSETRSDFLEELSVILNQVGEVTKVWSNGFELWTMVSWRKQHKTWMVPAHVLQLARVVSIGSNIVMPAPKSTDNWLVGNFHAQILDETPDGKSWLVEDKESYIWEIEKNRLS